MQEMPGGAGASTDRAGTRGTVSARMLPGLLVSVCKTCAGMPEIERGEAVKIQETTTPGKILIDCDRCGKFYPVDDFRSDEYATLFLLTYEHNRTCPECLQEITNAEERKQAERQSRQIRRNFDRIAENCGLPFHYTHDREGNRLTSPPVRFAAEWIWNHRFENLLISGTTGSGKSSGACFAAMQLILQGANLRYTTLRKLLAEWREAKTSDNEFAADRLIFKIFHLDYFIIDEFIGKARVTESGQELLFELLEGVNSGECRSRIWLIGNFYAGSIEETFSDPDPVRRRLQENFSCVLLDRANQSVKQLTVWEKK